VNALWIVSMPLKLGEWVLRGGNWTESGALLKKLADTPATELLLY
jgi:hypothetical protein